MPIDPKAAAGTFGGVGETLTRKVGPLPLWAYAVLAGGAAIIVRARMGGGRPSSSSAGSPFIPYAPATSGGGGSVTTTGTSTAQPPSASSGTPDKTILPPPPAPPSGASVAVPPVSTVSAPPVTAPRPVAGPQAPPPVTTRPPAPPPAPVVTPTPTPAPAKPAPAYSVVTTASGPTARFERPGLSPLDFPLAQWGGVVPSWLAAAVTGGGTPIGSPGTNAASTPAAPTTPVNVAAPVSEYDRAGLAQLGATGAAPGYIPSIGTKLNGMVYSGPGVWVRESLWGTAQDPASPNYVR